MLRGYWGIYGPVIGCLILAGVGLADSKRQHQNTIAAHRAAKQHDRRPQQRDTVRAGVPASAQAFISNPEPDEGTEREKRDLAAQEATTVWAFWMVVLSIAQAVLSAVGILFIWRSLRQGQLGVDAATSALAQARHESRAWVSLNVEPIKIAKVGESLRFFYRVIVENKGGIAATNLELRHTILCRDVDIAEKITDICGVWEARRGSVEAVVLPGEIQSRSTWHFAARSEFGLDGESGLIDAIVLVYAMYTVGSEPDPRYTRRTFSLSEFKGSSVAKEFDFGDSDAVRPFISEYKLPMEPPRLIAESHASAAT